MTDPKTDLCYPVLTPFKFGRVIVKPPALIQMSAEEARAYQAAGVLGGEEDASLPPDPERDDEPEQPVPVDVAPAAAEAEAPTATSTAPAEAAASKPAAATKKAAKKKAAK